jgi:glycosyltransferase involved in cell wall biosynthesis
MPRRVLIIVENLPVPFDRRVWLEATTLARAGYEVSVICPAMKGFTTPRERLDGVDIWRHPLPHEASGALGYVVEYGAALFWQSWLALRIALGRGFDVIHACNPPDLIFLVAAPYKLLGKKFLFDQHDLCPELYEAKAGKRGFFHAGLKLVEALTFRLADVVISTNESYRAVALSRGARKAGQVFVVRSGPDLARWPRAAGGDPKWKNGRAHLVGYVGVMGEQEGLDLLLESIRIIVRDRGRDDVQLLLIGSGSYKDALVALTAQLGLQDYVTFTGRVSDEVLRDALAASDVCVNPDKPSELNDKSTMNKIIEYMAIAKPIVQFEVTEGRFSAQEASLYARPGDVADLADKLLQLIDDPDARARMGEFGRRRVETALAWDHSAKALLAAYDKVFEGRPALAARPVESGETQESLLPS